MLRTRRSLATLGFAAVALLLASCGVDPGDSAAKTPTTSSSDSSSSATTEPGSTATTAPSKDLTPEQQQLADRMAKAYEDLGFTDDEATCLSEGIAGTIGPGESTPDVTGMMDVVNDCDISMDRLMDIQGGMGDGTTEGALKESLASGFKASGMTQKQADCVAGAFIDKYGVDVEAMMDSTKMAPLAEQCGVDVTQISPGG